MSEFKELDELKVRLSPPIENGISQRRKPFMLIAPTEAEAIIMLIESFKLHFKLENENVELKQQNADLSRQRDDMRKLAGETGVRLSDAEDKVQQLEAQCATQQAAIKEYFAWRNACGDKEKTHDELRSHIEQVDKLGSEALSGMVRVNLLIKAQIGEEVIKIAEMPSALLKDGVPDEN